MTAKSKRKNETHNNSDYLFFFFFFIFFYLRLFSFQTTNKKLPFHSTAKLNNLIYSIFRLFLFYFILFFELVWKGRELRHDAIERQRSQEGERN